jgi:hypothetical protein
MAADRKRGFTNDLAFAIMVFAMGLAVIGLALTEIKASKPQEVAQATQPLQP